MLSLIENKTIEFKTSFQKEVIETVVAFANSKGGHIFIGIDDSGKITGIDISNETIQNYINIIKQATEPKIIVDIELIQKDEKSILDIEVDEYPIKPVSYKGRYFKRRNNSNHQMTPIEISNAHLKTISSSWDYIAIYNVKLWYGCMKQENIILDKSFAFSIRIVKLYKYLCSEKKEYILSKQLLKCGTSIAANVNEVQAGQSKKDFISKLSISSKEARETKYWINLLIATDYLDLKDDFTQSMVYDIEEIIKLLVSIIKTSKGNAYVN